MKINTTEQKTVSLTLDLNLKEAMILKAICGAITGAHEGPRGMTDQVYAALGNMGVPNARISDNSHIHLPDLWDDVEAEDA